NTTLTPKGRFFTSLTPALVENFMARCWGKDLPSRRRFSLRGVCWSRMYQQRCPLPDEILDLVLQVALACPLSSYKILRATLGTTLPEVASAHPAFRSLMT
ncbi:hypothetical protein BHE74_00034432, partial [Ensete ventricosum]